jgi:hypothetical protein
MYGDKDKCMQHLLGISEVKRPLGRPTCTQVDSIKMELKAVG